MKKFFVFLNAFILGLLFSGCSTKLTVERLENVSNKETLVGPIYYLPTAKLDIEVKRQLKKCEAVLDANNNPVGFNIVFLVESDVTSKFIPDLENPYLFKYENLNNVFKKTTFNIELYENGTIKKINGNISDRTGTVIQNTTKGAIQIARMAMGLPSVQTYAPIVEFCNSETIAAIGHYDTLSDEIKRLKKELPSYGPNDRPAEELKIDKKKTALAKYSSHLTHKKLYSSIPAFDVNGEWNKELPVPASVFLKWFDLPLIQPLVDLQNDIKRYKNDEAQLLKEASQATDIKIKKAKKEQAKVKRQLAEDTLNIFQDVINNQNLSKEIHDIAKELNAIATINISKNLLAISSSESAKKSESFVYRQPRSATLSVCKLSSCEEKFNVIHRKSYLLPQAGIYTTLPLENGAFDDNVLTANFGPSGNLEGFDYVTEAQAEKASATFAEAVGAAGKIVDADRDSDVINLQRELDLLNLQNQLLEAENVRDTLLGN